MVGRWAGPGVSHHWYPGQCQCLPMAGGGGDQQSELASAWGTLWDSLRMICISLAMGKNWSRPGSNDLISGFGVLFFSFIPALFYKVGAVAGLVEPGYLGTPFFVS